MQPVSNEDLEPPVAQAGPLGRKRPQVLSELGMLQARAAVVAGRRREPDDAAGPPPLHRELRTELIHGPAEPGGPYHSFPRRCCSACLSRVRFATSVLSFRFSSSRAFNRFSSLTSRPPQFNFYR